MLDLPFLAAEEEEIGAQLPASAVLTEAVDRTKRQEVCDSAGGRTWTGRSCEAVREGRGSGAQDAFGEEEVWIAWEEF